MSQTAKGEINVLELSQLGRSLDACIKAERADLDEALARYDTHMTQVGERLAALEQAMGEHRMPSEEWLRPLTEAVHQLHTVSANARAEAAAEAEWKVQRLEQLHVAQIEAAQARERALAEESRCRVEDLQNRVASLLIESGVTSELNNRLKEQLFRAEEALAQGRQQSADLTERLEAFKRNAAARDAMLREECAQVRLVEREVAVREAARALSAEQHLAAMAARHGAWSGEALPIDDSDRPPIETALEWLAGRAPQAMLSNAIADIAFEHDCGFALSDRDFVAAAYKWLLGRPHDEAGLEHYRRRLAGGMTRRDVLVALAQSAEACERTSKMAVQLPVGNEEYVDAAYRLVLERPADLKGASHYTAQLASGGRRETVLFDLANSQEAKSKPLVVATALRCVGSLRRQRRASPLRKTAYRLIGLHPPELQRAWQAGRLAAMAGDADREWQKVHGRISDLQAAANARVAAAEHKLRLQSDGTGTDKPRTFEGRTAEPLTALGDLDMLKDASADRTPGTILAAIRTELDAVGRT